MINQHFNLSCPTPRGDLERILLAHGGGGRLMHQLLDELVLPPIANDHLRCALDSAILQIGSQRLAFTTDSFVVRPLVFPGGDIGKLAVCGTINDLAMAGAKPLYLSLGLIIEEGLSTATLAQIMASIGREAAACGVQVVTGDTKVVDKGRGDGIYINTAGIGVVEHHLSISPLSVKAGDAVILSGDVGRHGMAIMAQRENLKFESTIESDCAPLHWEVAALLDSGIDVHCLRDLTRGGLASALVEIAKSANIGIEIDEKLIGVIPQVRAACELLGLDPLHVANEGRFVAFVPVEQAEKAVAVLNSTPAGATAAIVGRVNSTDPGLVVLISAIGGKRIVDMLSGEQLPRIC